MNSDRKWALILGASVVAAAITARRSLDASWKVATDRHLPDTPDEAKRGWLEALGWAALTGAVIGIARMITQTFVERLHD